MCKNPPRIHIVATGGTIASCPQNKKESTGLPAPPLDISELLSAIPQLKDIAAVSAEQLFQIGSTAISDAHWLKLSHRINGLVNQPDIDGVVVAHGTDTMEETAYFLNLTVKSEKPVVLTGAMRPATALCAEGPLNLLDSVLTAACPESSGMGVLVCMDEHILAARDAMKCSTFQVGAFQGTEYGLVGKIVDRKVSYAYAPLRIHTAKSRFDVTGMDKLPRVDIVYGYSDCGAVLLRAAAEQGAEGIVAASTGIGILHPDICDLYREHYDELPVLVRSSRVCKGGVMPNYFMDDDLYHTVASGDLSPQKARILLKLSLTQTHNIEEIRRIFSRY